MSGASHTVAMRNELYTSYPQLLHDPCLTPNMAETENKDGAERGAVLLGTGGNTGAGVDAGSVTMTLISRRCCISFVLKWSLVDRDVKKRERIIVFYIIVI